MVLRMCPNLLKNVRNLERALSQLDQEQCRKLFLLLEAVS